MPEAATAPPPAAPAAAPATPPAPPPSVPVAPPSPPPTKGTALDDAYGALDKFAGQPEPSAQPPSRRPKPAADAPPPDAPPADKGTEPPPATAPKQPIKAADLRAAYEALKPKYETVQKELAELKAKQFDVDKHPKLLKLTEDLNAAQKRRDELADELRFANYEKHPEYQEKYLQPYLDAYAEGQGWVAQLEVTDPATGEVRPGKPEDFDRMMQVFWSDPVQGGRVIRELFGDQAPGVMYHAKEIQKLLSAKNRALEHYRKEGGAREKQRSESMQKYQEQMKGVFDSEVKSGVEKYPKWFKPVDGDKDGNDLLEQGYRLADMAFGLEVRDADGKKVDLTPQDRLRLHAAIRNKAGAFDRMVYFWRKDQKRLTEVEAELAEFKSSEPGPGERGRGPKEPPKNAWDQVDEELAKRAR